MNPVIWPAVILGVSLFSSAHAGDTSPLEFVSEYLREFGAIERLRLAEEREFQAARHSMREETIMRDGRNAILAGLKARISRGRLR